MMRHLMDKRKENKKGRRKPCPPTYQCQKCLRFGHFTYECKNERTYTTKPSRSEEFRNPKLSRELNKEKAPKVPRATGGDWRRDRRRKPDSSDDEEETQKIDDGNQPVNKKQKVGEEGEIVKPSSGGSTPVSSASSGSGSGSDSSSSSDGSSSSSDEE